MGDLIDTGIAPAPQRITLPCPTSCPCAACRGAAPVPPPARYLDAFNARVRASCGGEA